MHIIMRVFLLLLMLMPMFTLVFPSLVRASSLCR